ncbi:uncharacterized protein PHACADRAFT_259399 [Phanerochaete carnosa HHB-10118-sp]|uniref:Uncharacterized protein n=1 Tax=Phanerochaete carnosa (strain HHB-10118-sp) TaxID=650164 RepID=K5VP07_PHACS|nr:uncharacterized protein PHACADRAFT_259399 [Phanerochaete carnosa HHB-10118-sp]EKM53208.1 hypothetical protein PHACADRAFT_259399 [Phanerochaete carnosa HHB-10118-sp]
MTICRAIFQQAGPNGKPWVCNHSCSGGSPLSHWRAVHGTTEPETFEGTWFGAVFCSIDEYYQYHGTTPPMNYRTGYPFRSHPVRYPKAVVDAKIAEYGGKCGWSTDRCDEWTEKEIGNLPMLYTRDGGEVEADESEETPVFYMNAEASTDSDGEIIDAGANPTRPALPTSPQDHAFASCPPSPPPAGCTGPWEEFPKECAHHDEFHRIWVLEGQMPENSYEPHCQTYSLHQKQNSIATPEGSNVAEQQPLAVAPAFAPVSWGMQQPSDASSTLTEFAWALEYFHQPATPHGTLQGCLVPPSTPSHIQSYYGLEAQSPSGDLSHYYSSAHPTYAPCPPVYSQYQSPPVVSSGWSSQHTSSAPTRQPSPVRSDDEQVAVEALLGLGSSKP